MAHIAVVVKTASSSSSSSRLGLLASISLTSKMADAVKDGYSSAFHAKREKLNRTENLVTKRQELLDAGCDVIATIGGLYVNTGVSGIGGATTPFVSMVGGIPLVPDANCKGGVSLETITLNAERRSYLVGTGMNVATMYLYRDGAGDVVAGSQPAQELAAWNAVANSVHFNTTGNFDNDLNQAGGIPATAEGLVVAASPVFLQGPNMSLLVTAANTWLTHPPPGRTRYVVYPLQIYREAGPTNAPSGRNILFGPDLYQVLRVLGFFASLAADGTSPGWLLATHPNNPI